MATEQALTDDLRRENARLRMRISELEAQIRFLGQHKTLAAGLTGEVLISHLVSGALTPHIASVDVITPNKTRLEVKLGKLTYPSPSKPSNPARWQWGKVLGEKNAKDFDFLILVGHSDPRYRSFYKDPDSPYVLFLLGRSDVERLSTKHTNGARGLLLLTNPNTSGPKAREFFERFELTTAELSDRFGVLEVKS